MSSVKNNAGLLSRSINIVRSWEILLALLISGIVRLIYYSNVKDTLWPDSKSYLFFLINPFKGQIDPERTPVYPYFIKLIRQFGEATVVHNVVIVQSIISFLAIILFYATIKDHFKNKVVIFLCVLSFGISPSIFNFDKCILTESLSISALVTFVFLINNYLKRPAISKSIILSVLVFVMTMLRPSFLILFGILIVFWGLRLLMIREHRNTYIWGIASSILCILLVMGYIKMNDKINKVNTISQNLTYNQLDNIINYEMISDGDDAEITAVIQKNLPLSHPPFYKRIVDTLYTNYPHNRIKSFVNANIVHRPFQYVSRSAKKFMLLSNQNISAFYALMKTNASEFFNSFTSFLSISFSLIYALLILEGLFALFFWIKYKQFLWLKLITVSIITLQLLTIVMGAQVEYQRLFLVTFPCVIISFFSYLDLLTNDLNWEKVATYFKLIKK